MKNSQKGFIGKLVLIIIAILIIGGLFLYYQNNNQSKVNNNVVDNFLSKCGFKVTSITPNEKVNFPLIVKGVIDNSNAKTLGCSWQMFEGEAGVAQLYFNNNQSWNPIGVGVPINVADWMTTSTTFSVLLNFNNDGIGLSTGTLMKITFTEENPSGQGITDSIDLPIIFGNISSVSENAVYENKLNGFSFSYPSKFSLADNETILNQPWEYNTTDTGNLIARVVIPRTIQPKTNFGEAYFDVGVSTSTDSIKNCLISSGVNTTDVSSISINDQSFEVFHYNDAGAGNFYDVTSYHTVKNGKCFVLESFVHSSNIGNYSPDQGIKEFDKILVNNILKNIVESFQFLN